MKGKGMKMLDLSPQPEMEESEGIDIGNGTSLDLSQAVYRDPQQPLHRQLLAARCAIAYEHPKLAVAVNLSGDDLAARMKATAMRKHGYDTYVIDAKPRREGEIEKAPE
jgi:hypothetical protein